MLEDKTVESEQDRQNAGDPEVHSFDVVIVGSGIGGAWQARHLMLKIPGIRVAIVDPRDEDDILPVKKIGESMVEIASMFAYKELGLHEYLVENHSPKFGLNFHWPRHPDKTDTIDDYYSIWTNRNPEISAFQLHRGTFEADMLRMNQEMGAVFFHGRAVDLDLNEGTQQNVVHVDGPCGKVQLKCDHLIDAAGRSFLVGRRTDNVVRDPETMWGLKNGSAWVRVDNVDRSLFHDGHDPECVTTSHYYGTNHYFGHGHWLWMIPIKRNSRCLSIGVMFHHDEIDPKSLSTEEKFVEFLRTNHNMLYKMVKSGDILDFRFKGKVSFWSKKMFSEDNWYVLGDSAAFGDAFYSLGTTIIAFTIESITEIIRAKRAAEKDAEEKRVAYNDFNLWYAKTVIHTYRDHAKQLGHASVMSWRVYFENMWWFGTHIPLFVGKWHLDPKFTRRLLANCEREFIGEVYEQFNELVKRNVNIGFMDTYRGDQLLGNYSVSNVRDHFLEDARYAPGSADVYKSFSDIYFYIALWYMKFQWKGWGLAGVLRPRSIYHFLRLMKQSAKTKFASIENKWMRRKAPQNEVIDKMRSDFEAYVYRPGVNDWLDAPRKKAKAS